MDKLMPSITHLAAAALLWKADRRFGLVAIPFACLIAFSRLYLFVHFPSDVLAAAALGLLIALPVNRFGDRLIDRVRVLTSRRPHA